MTEPIKQYVNLDPSNPDELKEIVAERAGRRIKLVAKLNKKQGGIPVVFEIIAASSNAHVDASSLSKKHFAYVKNNMGGLGMAGHAKRRTATNDQGEAEMEFILSGFGGDVFEVKAYVPLPGGKKGKELFTKKYVTWRRIYYQVSRFQAGTLGARQRGSLPEIPSLDWGPVEKELAAPNRKHCIELVKDDCKDLIPRFSNIIQRDTRARQDALVANALDGYRAHRAEVTMRCVLVNSIARQLDFSNLYTITAIRSTVTIEIERKLWMDQSMPRGQDAVTRAQWQFAEGPDRTWKPIATQLFEVAGPNKLLIHFEEATEEQFRRAFGPRPVEIIVALEMKVLDGSTNGLSWRNAIWMANENMHSGIRPIPQKQATAIHETGHYIGMASDLQKTHYTEKGHTGPHCSTGLSVHALKRRTYKGLSGTCVMFGESAKSRKPFFCAECDKSVRELEIRKKTVLPATA